MNLIVSFQYSPFWINMIYIFLAKDREDTSYVELEILMNKGFLVVWVLL